MCNYKRPGLGITRFKTAPLLPTVLRAGDSRLVDFHLNCLVMNNINTKSFGHSECYRVLSPSFSVEYYSDEVLQFSF